MDDAFIAWDLEGVAEERLAELLADGSDTHGKTCRRQIDEMVAGNKRGRLSQITASGGNKYLNHLATLPGHKGKLKSTRVHTRTTNQIRAAAVAFCNGCVGEKRLLEDPLSATKRRKGRRTVDARRGRPRPEEITALIRVAAVRHKPYFVLWAWTGQRTGTYKALRVAHYKPESHALRIPLDILKDADEDLWLPLHPEAEAAVLTLCAGKRPDELMFCGKFGVPWLTTFYKHCDAAGVARQNEDGQICRHANRHGMTTALLSRNVNADKRMTLEHYAALGVEEKRRVIEFLPGLLADAAAAPAGVAGTPGDGDDPDRPEDDGLGGEPAAPDAPSVVSPGSRRGECDAAPAATADLQFPAVEAGPPVSEVSAPDLRWRTLDGASKSAIVTHLTAAVAGSYDASTSGGGSKILGRLAQLARAHGSHP